MIRTHKTDRAEAGQPATSAGTPTAFVGVTVLPMDRNRVITDQTVVVPEGEVRPTGATDPNFAVLLELRASA